MILLRLECCGVDMWISLPRARSEGEWRNLYIRERSNFHSFKVSRYQILNYSTESTVAFSRRSEFLVRSDESFANRRV